MDSITEVPPPSETATVVRLVVPRALEYVPLARVTVAGYTARIGFDVDEIEDSRIAVDELARVLVEVGDGGTIEFTLEGAGGRLAMHGTTSCPPGTVAPELDQITSQILGAICNEYGVTIDRGTVRFRAALLATADE